MNTIPKVGILASGTNKGGGSGVRVIFDKILSGEFDCTDDITLITNYASGGVAAILDEYSERFSEKDIALQLEIVEGFPKRGADGKFTPEQIEWIKNKYQEIIKTYGLDYKLCSGWMKQILGVDPSICTNIHPGPTQEPYGGLNKHGDIVHKLVWEDYLAGKINHSCVTMHFVTEELGRGPIIAQIPVDISSCSCWEDVRDTVNKAEHEWQWRIYQMIIKGEITWSGVEGEDVKFPEGYIFGEQVDLEAEIFEEKDMYSKILNLINEFRIQKISYIAENLIGEKNQEKAEKLNNLVMQLTFGVTDEINKLDKNSPSLEKWMTEIALEKYKGEQQELDKYPFCVDFHRGLFSLYQRKCSLDMKS